MFLEFITMSYYELVKQLVGAFSYVLLMLHKIKWFYGLVEFLWDFFNQRTAQNLSPNNEIFLMGNR